MFLHFQAATNLNQDSSGRSRSVQLWVFQFKTAEAIQAASFDAVWLQGGASLVDSLAAHPDQVTFLPGEQAVRRLRRQPGAQYLAFAANFRDKNAVWKAIVRIPPPVDPCLQPQGQASPPPLRLHVYMQDYWMRIQANFHIPNAMVAPAPAPAQPAPVQAPPPQPTAPSQAPPPADSSGWLDPSSSVWSPFHGDSVAALLPHRSLETAQVRR